jgi:hypothetical protein
MRCMRACLNFTLKTEPVVGVWSWKYVIMRDPFSVICGILIVLTSICVFGQARPGVYPWSITFKIVDDAGQPVSAAKVQVGYMQGKQTEGLTDTNGVFNVSRTDRSWELGVRVQKEGYYSSYISYDLYLPGQFDEQKVTANRNATLTLDLKKIGKPISMYARKMQIEIPEIDKPIGFDLIVADWVAPYGKGMQSDFVFQVQRRWAGRNDFDSAVKVTFRHPGDGIAPISIPLNQGSELRMSATAPSGGYIGELSKNLSHTPENGWKKDEAEDQNYYFRVRTAIDDKGNIVSARYGKIYGDFGLDPINSKTTWILFTYYFNPTPNDQNVEFDPKQNLMTNLKFDEAIKAP